MEQIITLKVDLEHPDEARHTIDELVKMYEADKLKWTADELAEAKHLAMQIMQQLCLMGTALNGAESRKRIATKRFLFGSASRMMIALSEMRRAASLLLRLTLGLPSVSACAGLPAGTCPRSSSKRLVSAGDEFSQGAKPQAQTEAGNGSWCITKRCQQGAVDGEVHQPVL